MSCADLKTVNNNCTLSGEAWMWTKIVQDYLSQQQIEINQRKKLTARFAGRKPPLDCPNSDFRAAMETIWTKD